MRCGGKIGRCQMLTAAAMPSPPQIRWAIGHTSWITKDGYGVKNVKASNGSILQVVARVSSSMVRTTSSSGGSAPSPENGEDLDQVPH